MKTTTALLLLPLVLAAPAARAAAQTPEAEPAATVSASPTEDAKGASNDPNIDRAFLLPTAMTQPAGSATYNNYELVLHGFTYGITDHVQTTITVMAPLVEDMPFLGVAAVKGRLVVAPRLHLAAQGSAGLAHEFSGSGSTIGTLGAGVFASACLRADCSSLLSASVTYQLALADSNTGHLVIYGGSLVHSVGTHVKLLGEVTSIAARNSSESDFDNAPGVLVSYGVRLHGTSFASDIGFIKPIFDEGNDGIIMGLPFASLSYRWE